MKTRDAIKITVETTTKQSSWLDQVIGSARFTRNQLIALTDHYYENTGKFIGSSQLSVLSAHLPYLKKKFEFIKNVLALSLQNIAGDLEDDYRDYIAYLADPKGRKIGKPQFKSKSDKSSITIPINKKDIIYNHLNQILTFTKFKINNEQQYLNIKLFRSPFDCKPEEIQGFIREITITRLRYKKNKYQISFSFARTAEAQPPYEPVTVSSFCEYKDIKTENFDCDSFRREAYQILSKQALGIDVGIHNFLVASDPKILPIKKPLNWKVFDKRLRKAQRKLSRKLELVKGKKKSPDYSVLAKTEADKKKLEKELEKERKRVLQEQRRQEKLANPKAVTEKKPKLSRSKATRFGKAKKPKSKNGSNQNPEIMKLIDDAYSIFESNKAEPPKKSHKNIEKAKAIVAKLFQKITNQNRDFLNKVVFYLVAKRPEKIICIEDLNIIGMMSNHKLAKAIGRSTWGLFFRLLENKLSEHGKLLLRCGRFDPSSKECNHCHHKNEDLKLSDRIWICSNCGKLIARDFNASENVKDFAIKAYIGKLLQNHKNSEELKDEQVGKEIAELLNGNSAAVSDSRTPFRHDISLEKSGGEALEVIPELLESKISEAPKL